MIHPETETRAGLGLGRAPTSGAYHVRCGNGRCKRAGGYYALRGFCYTLAGARENWGMCGTLALAVIPVRSVSPHNDRNNLQAEVGRSSLHRFAKSCVAINGGLRTAPRGEIVPKCESCASKQKQSLDSSMSM